MTLSQPLRKVGVTEHALLLVSVVVPLVTVTDPLRASRKSVQQPGTYFMIKTRGEPNSIAGTVRRKIHELELQRSVYDLSPLTGHISDAYAENRLRTVLLAFFALTAIGLASVGLYGIRSVMLSQSRSDRCLRGRRR
jgi:hypothetical protein